MNTLAWGESMISIVARVLSAGLLVWALDKHSYDYFVLLRWVVCATAAFTAYVASEQERIGWVWVFGIVALLFNPIIPVHLSRQTWAPIDIGTAIVMIVSLFSVRENRKDSRADSQPKSLE